MKPVVLVASFAFSCVALAASALPASAQEVVLAPDPVVSAPEASAPAPLPRYDLIRVNAGFRIGYLPTRAFDAYSSNDVLAQFSIDATYPLLTRGKLVLAAGLGWDSGGRSDTVRGFESSVSTHRFYVPIEGRYHFVPWMFGFGKVSPGAAVVTATVKDGGSPDELSATGGAFSADASIGASILLGPRAHLEKRGPVRFWATPEIGYSFTTNAPLAANSGREDKDVLGSDENTHLRSLALTGFFWRASIAATF